MFQRLFLNYTTNVHGIVTEKHEAKLSVASKGALYYLKMGNDSLREQFTFLEVPWALCSYLLGKCHHPEPRARGLTLGGSKSSSRRSAPSGPERRRASRPRCQRAPLSMEASSARLYRSVASLSASGGGSRARLQPHEEMPVRLKSVFTCYVYRR